MNLSARLLNALILISSKCIRIIDHPFFLRLRNTLIDSLQKSIDNYHLSYRISAFFYELTNHTNDQNIQLIRTYFADSNLTKCLVQSLNTLSPKSNHCLVSSIEQMFDAYQKFQDDRPAIQNDPVLSTLIMPIVNLVQSSEYQTSFLQLSPQQDQLTPYQKFILVTCSTYINTYWGHLQVEIAAAIAQLVLIRSSEILEYFLPSIDQWQEPVIWSMYPLVLLCQRCANEHLLPAYGFQHTKILHYVLTNCSRKRIMASCQS